MKGSKIPQYLEELEKKWPRLVPKYTRSTFLKDILFRADYTHVDKIKAYDTENEEQTNNDDQEEGKKEGNHCINCNPTKIIRREPRDMCVHYGLITSGKQVIKDAVFQDEINKKLGGNVLCFKIEATELMNGFLCLII